MGILIILIYVPLDEECESVFIYFSKSNRTVLFYFLDWLKTSKNDFGKQGARKGIADSTYLS